MQDAYRKRTSPSLDTGTWASSIVRTKDAVNKTVTQEGCLKELRRMIGRIDHPRNIFHKYLERIRVFINHMSLTC